MIIPYNLSSIVPENHCPHANYLGIAEANHAENLQTNPSGTKNCLIVGRVVEVNKNHVTINTGQVVPFDFLINFTGSVYHSDIKTETSSAEARRKRMAAERENISKAGRVLVVGGGVVGCELSADIQCEFPDKSVVLVHAHHHLLPRIPGAHSQVLSELTKVGVEVH